MAEILHFFSYSQLKEKSGNDVVNEETQGYLSIYNIRNVNIHISLVFVRYIEFQRR